MQASELIRSAILSIYYIAWKGKMCSASDGQGSNFESCVWRTVSSQSSHHPQEVLLAQFSLYVYKGGLKPDSFHLKRQNAVVYKMFCWNGKKKTFLLKWQFFSNIVIFFPLFLSRNFRTWNSRNLKLGNFGTWKLCCDFRILELPWSFSSYCVVYTSTKMQFIMSNTLIKYKQKLVSLWMK